MGRPLVAAVISLAAVTALARESSVVDRFNKEFQMTGGATVIVENPVGNVEVIGTDDSRVVVAAERTIKGPDADAVEEGRAATRFYWAGDERARLFRTLVPPLRGGGWTAVVKYTIHVPRTSHVSVASHSSDRIRIADIRGNVTINNINGTILLERITGATAVDSANGNIIYIAAGPLLASANLNTVNGNIEVRAPGQSSFQWVSQTIKGDARTTFPVRLRAYPDNLFRGSVNAPGGPTIQTRTLMGNIFLLMTGTQSASAKSLRSIAPEPGPDRPAFAVAAQTIQQAFVQGYFEYQTSMGNIRIGEVRGAAKVMTGAGEVELRSVFGACQVVSLGGPLNLGDIFGVLNARTEAGDILVQAAREGGTIITGGGMIRLLYNGGPSKLWSGGGDIVVRQAAAPIIAETKSGDITVTVDPSLKTQKVSARTAKGNVVLNVTPRFAADIDVTVITSESDANKFKSDFAGLSIQRDRVNGKTRIRATGKINGGGERVDLYAEDGRVTITANTGSPISVIAPQ